MKKITLIISVLALLLLIPVLVSAAVSGPMESVTNLLNNIFQNVSVFFSMNWAFENPQNFAGFVRFLLWLTVFTIFHGAGQLVFGRMFRNNEAAGNRTAVIIALVIATITALFTPLSVLYGWGETWTVIVMFVLIGAPIGGVLYFAYGPQGLQAIMEPGWGLRLSRIAILLLCWELTHLVSTWGDSLMPGTGRVLPAAFIIPIIGISLINKTKSNKKRV